MKTIKFLLAITIISVGLEFAGPQAAQAETTSVFQSITFRAGPARRRVYRRPVVRRPIVVRRRVYRRPVVRRRVIVRRPYRPYRRY